MADRNSIFRSSHFAEQRLQLSLLVLPLKANHSKAWNSEELMIEIAWEKAKKMLVFDYFWTSGQSWKMRCEGLGRIAYC